MSSEGDIGALIASARQGDQDAAGQLYVAYSRYCFSWKAAYGLLMNDDDWKDLWHDAWIRVLRNLPLVDDTICNGGSFGRYVKLTCRSLAIDRRRRQLSAGSMVHIGVLQERTEGNVWEFMEDLPVSNDDPEGEVIASMEVDSIMEVLQRALPKARRARPIGYEVWRRARADAIGVTAAARMMGITREAAKHQDEQFRIVLEQEMRIEGAVR